MKILILGGDGYLGWPTSMYFSERGHQVIAIDNYCKRKIELDCDVSPLTHVRTLEERAKIWNELQSNKIEVKIGDLQNYRFVYDLLEDYKPDCIIHYAEQPSAPYSMRGRKEAVFTQQNNVIGNLNLLFAIKANCPQTHLIKLGTMGAYGTPNIDIEEGYLNINHNGRDDYLPFPKSPFSFYHLSKCADSDNILFACKSWGLRATDLNQGVVYGIETDQTKLDKKLNTSFHYDAIFGTIVNRFCVQATNNLPLTIYGTGGQNRTFLNIMDTLQCVEIAMNNPPKESECKIFNQFTEIFNLMDLAEIIQKEAKKFDLNVSIEKISNPRVEKEQHYYNPKNDSFLKLGLKKRKLEDFINTQINFLLKEDYKIKLDCIKPNIKWNKT
tara:strand:- start:510 stop:1661 length:1152 start_codon:yes stop_codon:yes gene_type:complete